MMRIHRHCLGYLAAVAATVFFLPILSAVPANLGFSVSSLRAFGPYVFFVALIVAAYAFVPYLAAFGVLRQFKLRSRWAYTLAGTVVGMLAYTTMLGFLGSKLSVFMTPLILAQIAVVGALATLAYHSVTHSGGGQ